MRMYWNFNLFHTIDFICTFDLKILYARDIDQRGNTFEKALSMGKDYQRRCKVGINVCASVEWKFLMVMCGKVMFKFSTNFNARSTLIHFVNCK